jgi:hypothetical protein
VQPQRVVGGVVLDDHCGPGHLDRAARADAYERALPVVGAVVGGNLRTAEVSAPLHDGVRAVLFGCTGEQVGTLAASGHSMRTVWRGSLPTNASTGSGSVSALPASQVTMTAWYSLHPVGSTTPTTRTWLSVWPRRFVHQSRAQLSASGWVVGTVFMGRAPSRSRPRPEV